MIKKISIYITLVLLYLALSKSFTPSEQDILYIPSHDALSSSFEGSPLTVILLDQFVTGVLAKTYYLKLKVVHSFHQPVELLARTTKKFYELNYSNIGLSIYNNFAHLPSNEQSSFSTPTIPGIVFLGNSSFGQFRFNRSGALTWNFYRAYRSIADYLGWDNYIPTYNDYQQAMMHLKHQLTYTGPSAQFGREGSIITKVHAGYINKEQKRTQS